MVLALRVFGQLETGTLDVIDQRKLTIVRAHHGHVRLDLIGRYRNHFHVLGRRIVFHDVSFVVSHGDYFCIHRAEPATAKAVCVLGLPAPKCLARPVLSPLILSNVSRFSRVLSKPAQRLAVAAGLVWLVLLAFGLKALGSFDTAAGSPAHAPLLWPSASKLVPFADTTVVMFLHPQCACSRASLTELNVILEGTHGRAIVVFRGHPGTSATYARAAEMPGVTRVIDEDDSEAKRFGALTSGQVVVYDGQRKLQFAGGITGSRGHLGDNMGEQTVLALLRRESVTQTGHAVFGCPLEARP